MTDLLLIIAVSLTCAVAVFLSMKRDAYERGFDDGLHSRLASLAKQRHHRDVDVCLFIVPQEEYDRETAQFT